MAEKMPFDEDMMTLIMGISPEEPGQHGRTKVPNPGDDAITVITSIRDMCDDFLKRAGKETDVADEGTASDSETDEEKEME